MTQETYRLDITHWFGEQTVVTNHVIDAENRQKAKYWFHRHYKTFGHKPAWATNKHTIDVGHGHVVELEHIHRIEDHLKGEWLRGQLPLFPKE